MSFTAPSLHPPTTAVPKDGTATGGGGDDTNPPKSSSKLSSPVSTSSFAPIVNEVDASGEEIIEVDVFLCFDVERPKFESAE